MAQLLLVLIGALLVTAVAQSREIAAPLLLVGTGLLVSLIPGTVPFHIDPEILLTVVLPPLLYSAALESSYVNFRARIVPILHHGVLQVVFTAFAVGWVAFVMIPDLPLDSAIVLGAVVAPTDAVTASAIGRRLGLPRPVMTVLGGESLINDAAALTIYRMAIAAVVAATPTLAVGLRVFTLAVVFGVGVGLVIGVLAQAARTRVPDVQVATVLGALVPFTAYLLAEQIHGSGVLAVVTAGLYVGHNQPRARAFGRLEERSLWASINLLLESLVFALIGLELRTVSNEVIASVRDLSSIAVAILLILASTFAVRFVWMFGSNTMPWLSQYLRTMPGTAGGWRRALVLSWTGMRGVVTLAAAGAVPPTTSTGEPFPGVEVIQFVAVVITIATILVQGTTLPWLIRALRVADPQEAEQDNQDEADARRAATNAALAHLDEMPAPGGTDPASYEQLVERMRALVQHQGEAAAEQVGRTPSERDVSMSRLFVQVRRELLEVERRALADERDSGRLDDEVLRRIVFELDLQEAALDRSWRNR